MIRFDCKKGFKLGCKCDCCGIVPIPENIFNKHKSKITINYKINEELKKFHSKFKGYIVPITDDYKCPFLDRDNLKCIIYEDRPNICRDYGVMGNKSKYLQCPYLKPNGNVRNKKEIELIKKW